MTSEEEYIRLQDEWLARTGVKVGSKVLVTATAEDSQCGWSNTWISDMDKAVGLIGELLEVSDASGLYLCVSGVSPLRYPFFVLSPVSDSTDEAESES